MRSKPYAAGRVAASVSPRPPRGPRRLCSPRAGRGLAGRSTPAPGSRSGFATVSIPPPALGEGRDGLEPDGAGQLDRLVNLVDHPAGYPAAPRRATHEPSRRGGSARARRGGPRGAGRARCSPDPRLRERETEHVAERPELAVVPDRDDERVVRGPQCLVGRDRRMTVAHPAGDDPCGQPVRRLVREREQRGGQQSTSTSCPSPVRSRWRSAARIPIAACNPVITSTSATSTFAARLGISGIDMSPPIACARKSYPGTSPRPPDRQDTRSGRSAISVRVEPGALHHARSEVLDHDVGSQGQRPRGRDIAGILQVQGDASLVPVRAEVVGGHPCGRPGRAPGARVVAVPGRSTLITSAPRSPRIIVASGPARTREKSATRIPSRAPAETDIRGLYTISASAASRTTLRRTFGYRGAER